jgi:hypothetical protein
MNHDTARKPEFRGHLHLFVDVAPAEGAEQSAITFDDVFGVCEPGSMRWFLSGWAVGKNPQGRYCARTSLSKAKRFGTFAEAMDYVRMKRKARPQEAFYLVYVLEGKKSIITSLEQIQRLDNGLSGSGDAITAAEADPLLERIAIRTGKIVATNALALHRILQHEGEASARARFSSATYDRLWQVLVESGVVAETNSEETTDHIPTLPSTAYPTSTY